jgi:magnesium chelatase family protein
MTIVSYAPGGFHGHIVTVEVDCRTGLPGTDIVGLPGSEVREARDRVRVAIRRSGFVYPVCRILVNLSPADIPKSGNGFDLAIAVAVLVSSGQLPEPRSPTMVMGELHLDGRVGGVRGVLAAVSEAAAAGVVCSVVPEANLAEGSAVAPGSVFGVGCLRDIRAALSGKAEPPTAAASESPSCEQTRAVGDYASLRGHAVLKRVIEIAAAGAHNLLVVGPPGAGKTMGVSLMPTILPPLTRDEAVEVTRLRSLAGEDIPTDGLVRIRPFRAPHHNSTVEGLLGGGRTVVPGEVSLAHKGVLFLDEALEFGRQSLQSLREPLERRRVLLSRAGHRYWFPAEFQLALASNPCPCGHLGRSDRRCMCGLTDVDRYWKRLGAPLLDRIELRLFVKGGAVGDLPGTDTSGQMRYRVERAIAAQESRRVGNETVYNGRLSPETVSRTCAMTKEASHGLAVASSRIGLSARAWMGVTKVARTIADLDDEATICEGHVYEAVQHRRRGEDLRLWE